MSNAQDLVFTRQGRHTCWGGSVLDGQGFATEALESDRPGGVARGPRSSISAISEYLLCHKRVFVCVP